MKKAIYLLTLLLGILAFIYAFMYDFQTVKIIMLMLLSTFFFYHILLIRRARSKFAIFREYFSMVLIAIIIGFNSLQILLYPRGYFILEAGWILIILIAIIFRDITNVIALDIEKSNEDSKLVKRLRKIILRFNQDMKKLI
jgi:hypothetical protein